MLPPCSNQKYIIVYKSFVSEFLASKTNLKHSASYLNSKREKARIMNFAGILSKEEADNLEKSIAEPRAQSKKREEKIAKLLKKI